MSETTSSPTVPRDIGRLVLRSIADIRAVFEAVLLFVAAAGGCAVGHKRGHEATVSKYEAAGSELSLRREEEARRIVRKIIIEYGPSEGTESGAPPQTETKTVPVPDASASKPGAFLLKLLGVRPAYAQTAPSQQQLEAIMKSMGQRLPVLSRYKADGSVGENRLGYVEARPSDRMRSDRNYAAAVAATIEAENADRRRLYQTQAQMYRSAPEGVAASYAKVWQDKAKPGEWIEVLVDRQTNKWEWRKK